MRPARSLRIRGTTSRHMRTAPNRLVSNVSRHTEVRVSIIPTPTIGPDQACIELAKEIEVEVALGSPLGDRAVVDAATGTQLKVTPR